MTNAKTTVSFRLLRTVLVETMALMTSSSEMPPTGIPDRLQFHDADMTRLRSKLCLNNFWGNHSTRPSVGAY